MLAVYNTAYFRFAKRGARMDKLLHDWFTQNREKMVEASRALWNQPEFSEHEAYAAQLLSGILEHEGFTVQHAVAGLPTAFAATWGQGAPRIGFLAEYDALPGLSQEAVPYKAPIEGQGAGHGCGHNLLGVGALAAGMALKHALQNSGAPGTVIVYGCPSEELMLGKPLFTMYN